MLSHFKYSRANLSLSYEEPESLMQDDVLSAPWLDSYSWLSVDTNGSAYPSQLDPDVLTIESLRNHYKSCSSCGVSWHADHVTLDCHECGGYAMHRPCLECNGQCESIWRRDIEASHQNKNAQWEGICKLNRDLKQNMCFSSANEATSPLGRESMKSAL